MRLFSICSLLAATATFASADPASSVTGTSPARPTEVHQMHTDDCARARAQHRDCVIDMGKGDTIDGTAPTAGGSAINVVSWIKASSLIHIRRDFIPEILKTAEDL